MSNDGQHNRTSEAAHTQALRIIQYLGPNEPNGQDGPSPPPIQRSRTQTAPNVLTSVSPHPSSTSTRDQYLSHVYGGHPATAWQLKGSTPAFAAPYSASESGGVVHHHGGVQMGSQGYRNIGTASNFNYGPSAMRQYFPTVNQSIQPEYPHDLASGGSLPSQSARSYTSLTSFRPTESSAAASMQAPYTSSMANAAGPMQFDGLPTSASSYTPAFAPVAASSESPVPAEIRSSTMTAEGTTVVLFIPRS